MISNNSFLPLYFGEEDAEVWAALQNIPAEERSTFVKKVLREALLPSPASISSTTCTEERLEQGHGARHEPFTGERLSGEAFDKKDSNEFVGVPEEDFNLSEEFSLESLFVSGDAGKMVLEPAKGGSDRREKVGTAADAPALARNPWDHLLRTVIGEEDDPEVISIISSSAFRRPEVEAASQSERTSGEVDHILTQIIGEEDNEEVIRLLRGTAKEGKVW